MSNALPFDHLIFDLDDTLLDTFRQLVPRASLEACQTMIEAGLNATVETCLSAWEEHGKHHARRDIFSHLTGYFGTKGGADPRAVAKRGYFAFYHRRVNSDISLIPGVREMLSQLGGRYCLHLVTSGIKSTQDEKIRLLGLREFFSSIHHVDPSKRQKKFDAFSIIQSQDPGSAPNRHLSIGNRIDTDIGEARLLNWKGCWVRYGEHAALEPTSDFERPDFIIEKITDLPEICHL